MYDVYIFVSDSFRENSKWVWITLDSVCNKNYILTGITVVLVIAQFLLTTFYSRATFHFTSYVQVITDSINIERATFSMSAFSELFISCTLIYLLSKSRTGFKSSNTMLSKLMTYTMATGLITSLNEIAGLAIAFALPHTFYHPVFGNIGAKRNWLNLLSIILSILIPAILSIHELHAGTVSF